MERRNPLTGEGVYMSLFNERIKAAGFEDYDEYLRSSHWQFTRRLYAESGRPRKCFSCDNPQYQLHHISYVRLGRESLDDVLPLCRPCHMTLHACEDQRVPYEIFLICAFFFPSLSRSHRKRKVAQFTNRNIPRKRRQHKLMHASPEDKDFRYALELGKLPVKKKYKHADVALTKGGQAIKELIRRMNSEREA